MRDISTEIIIDASRSDVWRVLVDMPGYNRWNPFMTYEGGEVKVGATLHLNVHLPGAWVTPLQVRVLTVTPEQELVWLGHFLNIPRLIDGYHSFLLIENGPDQTRLVHKEHFEGVLLPFFFGWFTERKIKQGMERMNPALKRVVETVRR